MADILFIVSNKVLLKEIRIPTFDNISVYLTDLTIYQFNWFKGLGNVFHTNVIAYCLQNLSYSF